MADYKKPYERQGGGGGSRFYSKPKFCQFCADKTLTIDYKKVDLLRKYVTEEGTIRPRRQTGACSKHQRFVAAALKQARKIALLPFTGRHTEEMR
jgi:small subunit ribosomal protein S18